MRVALVCEESAGARVLEDLARDAHEVVALVTSQRSPAWNLGVKLGLRPLAAGRVREPDFPGLLARAGAQLLLNVHSLYIVPPAVLRVPPLGAYNLHPGPLPHYAGLNAPSWAIYRGEARHGITVHRRTGGGSAESRADRQALPRSAGKPDGWQPRRHRRRMGAAQEVEMKLRTCSGRGSGSTAPYPVVASAAAALA